MTVRRLWRRLGQAGGPLLQRVRKWPWRVLLTVLLLGPAAGFIAYQTIRNWEVLRRYPWLFRPDLWGGALLAYSAALFALLWAWDRTLEYLGGTTPFRANARVYCLTNLGKRIPGAIWYIAGRVHLYRQRGVRGAVTVVGSVLEFVFLAATGLLTYLLTLPFSQARSTLHLTVVAVALPVTIILLQPRVFNGVVRFLLRRIGRDIRVEITYRQLLPLIPAYLATWGLAGIGLYILIYSLYPLDPALLPDVVGLWAISGTSSMLLASVLLGSGVREIALSFLLAAYMPQPMAVVAAVGFWFIVAIGEVLWAGIFALIGREAKPDAGGRPGGDQLGSETPAGAPHSAPLEGIPGPPNKEPIMVDVVVLSWNFKEYTLNCLESVLRMRYPDFHVLLVDNASTDGTVPAVRERFPQVEIHVNAEDVGFTGGMNVGMQIALERQSPYVLLVSNDTVVEPDLLERLVEAAESEPRVGIVSPLIYYPGRERIWYAGAYRRRFWPGITWLGFGLRDRPRYHVRRQVDYVTGCVLLLRTAMLRQVGLFDATFFMYHEDLDLCERARRAGWRLLMVPEAVVDHIGSASYGEFSATKWFYLARNLAPLYQRYYRRPRLSLLLYMGWIIVRETLKGNIRVLPPLWRGFRAGWRETFGHEQPRERSFSDRTTS